MNNSFGKGKLSTWYGSRFYNSCLVPLITYTKWLSMQPDSVLKGIYGKSRGEVLKVFGPACKVTSPKNHKLTLNPPYHKGFKCIPLPALKGES